MTTVCFPPKCPEFISFSPQALLEAFDKSAREKPFCPIKKNNITTYSLIQFFMSNKRDN